MKLPPPRPRGFTIIEVLVAMWIFSMIILGIYTVWSIILKATRSGQNAAAAAQRSRITIRTVEDALLTAQMFTATVPQRRYYAFVADTSGDFAAMSFVARLPASFPGVGHYGDKLVRRVSFYVDNDRNLMMTQAPMLMAMNKDFEPYSLALAKDVTMFLVEFWGQDKGEWKWVQEWSSTNQLPKMVRVAIGMGKSPSDSSKPRDISMRVVAMAAMAVPPQLQLGGPMGQPGGPGGPPGGFPGGGGGGLPGGGGGNRPLPPNLGR